MIGDLSMRLFRGAERAWKHIGAEASENMRCSLWFLREWRLLQWLRWKDQRVHLHHDRNPPPKRQRWKQPAALANFLWWPSTRQLDFVNAKKLNEFLQKLKGKRSLRFLWELTINSLDHREIMESFRVSFHWRSDELSCFFWNWLLFSSASSSLIFFKKRDAI